MIRLLDRLIIWPDTCIAALYDINETDVLDIKPKSVGGHEAVHQGRYGTSFSLCFHSVSPGFVSMTCCSGSITDSSCYLML